MSQKNSPPLTIQSSVNADPGSKNASAKKARLSFTAIKGIVTAILIVGLVLVVLQIYYPGIFPWN